MLKKVLFFGCILVFSFILGVCYHKYTLGNYYEHLFDGVDKEQYSPDHIMKASVVFARAGLTNSFTAITLIGEYLPLKPAGVTVNWFFPDNN